MSPDTVSTTHIDNKHMPYNAKLTQKIKTVLENSKLNAEIFIDLKMEVAQELASAIGSNAQTQEKYAILTILRVANQYGITLDVNAVPVLSIL